MRYSANNVCQFLCFFVSVAMSGIAWGSPSDDLKALLEKGKTAEAYQLGRKTPDELGNPAFDFYFGVAAVNSGKASEGVLALERFLLNFPDNDVARLELARGYFLAGESGRAKEEFEAILAKKPAPDVTRVIGEYLDVIKERDTKYASSAAWYVELGGGSDSNVQSGVDSPDISLPVFGPVTLADGAVRRSDRFSLVSGGARLTFPLRRNVQLFGTVAGESRQNREFDTFDQEFFSFGGGVNLIGEKSATRFSFTQALQTIDHVKYRDTATLTGEFGYQLAPSTSASLGVQLAQFRYGGDNAVRDADYNAVTLGMRQRLSGAWRKDFDFSLSYGREEAKLGDRQDLSRDLWGGHFGVNISPLPSWTFSTGLSVLKSDYKATDPLLLVTRDDRYFSFDLGAAYQLSRSWSLRAEYSRSRNKSNIPLYEYKRHLGSFKVRYDFK